MELAPLGDLQLPPGHCVKDVSCVCFHPLLPSAYVAVKRSVVEYDVLTGVEMGHFPLRLQATHLMFLKSRNAIVVCMVDGSIVVVEVTGGEILAEHQATKGTDAVPFACAELHELQGLPYLFAARTRAPSPVIAVNLFANNKKLLSFPAHKAAITCLTVHPTLPLLACSATDGTVRTFQLSNFSLYNVIDSLQDNSGGVRSLCRLQFHSGGSVLDMGSTSRKKKSKSIRKSKKLQLFKDIRLLVVAERSMISYYDISIPGAPSKLRDYFGSGSTYRDAHFHSFRSDLIFTLDHKGLFKALYADPGKVEQAPTALTLQRSKKKYVPNAKAFSLLEDYESMRAHIVKVRSHEKYGHSTVIRSLVDEDGKRSNWVQSSMHPTMPFFLFYGLDLADGRNRYLTIHHLTSVFNGRGSALPLNTQITATNDYWHSRELTAPHNTIRGTIYSASGEGNNLIVIFRHEMSTGTTERLMAVVPKNIDHGVPENIFHAGSDIVITVRSRKGSALNPFWFRKKIPHTPHTKPESVEFHPGVVCHATPSSTYTLTEEGKRVVVHSTTEGDVENHLLRQGLRIKTLIAVDCSGLLFIAHCTDGSGHPSVRIFREFEAVTSPEKVSLLQTIELDHNENLWEAACEKESGQLGLLTTSRVLILELSEYRIVACCSPPARLHSLHWVGWSLVFGSDKNLMSLTRDGTASRVASLPSRSTVAAVLADRVVLCSLDGGSAVIWSKYLNTFPILCRGILSSQNKSQIRSSLRDIVPRYNCSTVGMIPGLLQEIARKDLQDLASNLSSSSNEWETTCRLHILNKEFVKSLTALKNNSKKSPQAVVSRVVADIFQACSHSQSVNPHMLEEVLNVSTNHFEILSLLRKTNDPNTMQRLGDLSTNPSVRKLATELSKTMRGTDKKILLPPRSLTRTEAWTIGSTVKGVTVVVEDSAPEEQTELTSLTRDSINSYLWHNNESVSPVAQGGFNQPGEEDDDEGTSDEGSDDGGFQSPPPATTGHDDEIQSNPENEDEVARQQEELRNQYLNSFAGCGEDDDGGEDDDDGFERKNKFKKFTIKKEAIYQPAVLTNISLGFALPTASQGRHKNQAAEGSPGAEADGGSPQRDGPAPTEALPPSYLGTSADSCCQNGLGKLDRGRYDDALKRFQAALAYMKADSMQVVKKTPLIQVAHYIVTCHILKVVKESELDDDTADLPRLLWVLVQIPLGKKHVLNNAKKCVESNMSAGNYGIAKAAAEMCDDGSSVFAEQLETCSSNNFSNKSDFAADQGDGKVDFCWSTYQFIDSTTPTTRCSYCPATFTDTQPGGTCKFCSYGIIEE
eukprot:TRINITY_DN3450_c0_g1_i1.p1 TRINITY_DN3450_c0_g1~~TRINITY_DN3450_c0_g1_i1.p1  ORF type:complete len:1316 (+),score=229.85 TRINITY_DN3450_c0_g1_i1:475-4422(+)